MFPIPIPEVNGHCVHSGVGGTLGVDDLVHRYVGLSTVHCAESQAALLQLGLGVIPVLKVRNIS